MEWYFEQDEYGEYLPVVQSKTTIYDVNDNPICYMAPGCDEDDETIAKITAVPEMYEALKGVIKTMRCHNCTEKPLSNPEGYRKKVEMVPCGECDYCKAISAIAKAEGNNE
jgi:hypothetical protein